MADETHSFARLIADARAERGWTLLDVSTRAGVSVQYLNDIERGRRETTSVGVAERLAAALGIPVDVVFFRQGRMPPDLMEIEVRDEDIQRAMATFRSRITEYAAWQ